MQRIIFSFFEILAVFFLTSACPALGEMICEVKSSLNCVALTFDDGPSPVTTPQILEILASHQARATFFVTGINTERYPEIVRRMVKEGHQISNHTYCHFDLSQADKPIMHWQISAAQRIISQVIGFEVGIFRPPYSRIDKKIRNMVQAMGLKIIMWSVSPADYAEPSPRKIAEKVLSRIVPGSIVVMHDFRWQTVAALEEILRGLEKKGLRAVTVSELLEK